MAGFQRRQSGKFIFRTALFAATLSLIHLQHVARQETSGVSQDPGWILSHVRREMPAAAGVVTDDGGGGGLSLIVDADRQIIARVALTLPAARHIIGFSGPTQVLLLVDTDQTVVAAEILSSGDTQEHVRQVQADPSFLPSLQGKSLQDLSVPAKVDAVAGATLTSLAVLESIRFRLRQNSAEAEEQLPLPSLKFPEPVAGEIARQLIPDADQAVAEDSGQSWWKAMDAHGRICGWLLRTAPAADQIVGYQGPSETWIAFGVDGRVIDSVVGRSFDNEPYVDYLRDDAAFRSLFSGRDLVALAGSDIHTERIEGVAGATMTSQAVAEGMIAAAKAREAELARRAAAAARRLSPVAASRTSGWLSLRNVSTILMTLSGALLGLTRLRGNRRVRLCFQVLLLIWLGLMNGDMLSQALLLGWTQHGVPWQHAAGLTLLTFTAVLIPMVTGKNVYCAHVCPHGILQQWARNRLPWQVRLNQKAVSILRLLPVGLLIWVFLVGMLGLPFSVVDIEPFDAWLWNVAGLATIVVAAVGLVASLFVPMAYCRFGCPTGALLEHVRLFGASRWMTRDRVALVLFCAGVVILSV